jgi:short subunit dehydrogenase
VTAPCTECCPGCSPNQPSREGCRGSRGMGRDTAIRLAHQGVSSVITYNSRQDEAEKVVTAVREAGAAAVALQLNVGQADTFDGFVTQVRNALVSLGANSFDYLVNNAGTSSTATLENGTEAELDAVCSPLQGPLSLDAEAATADERWWSHREYLIRACEILVSRAFDLWTDEGSRRGPDPVHGHGARRASYRRERCRPRRHRHRLQWWSSAR